MEYASIEWRDGQPYSPDFEDVYFSVNDGRGESEHVFLQQNDLRARFAVADKFVIAETGFGTGLNFALTLKLWQDCAPKTAQLDYFAIEFAPLSPDDISRVASIWPDLADCFAAFLDDYPLPIAGRHLRSMLNGRVRLHLVFMDVVEALQNEVLAVDAWFLDGFSPAKNPEIWNQNVYALLAQNSAPSTTLATYSAAGAVRRGLEQAGFMVEKRPGHGNKREMIVARLMVATNDQPVIAPWFRLPATVYKKKQGIVIGAGLAGLSVAWALIQRGWTITVVDKHADIAAEASGNPAGLVQPRLSVNNSVDAQFYASAFLHASSRLNLLQAAYQTETGKNLWRREGVYCAMPSTRARQLLNRNQFHLDYVRSVERGIVPLQLMPDTDLLQIPSAGWASPRLICDAMRRSCGDKLDYVQANIYSIQLQEKTHGQYWQLMTDDQETLFETELLVLANGVDATRFMQTNWMPVRSARGQLTELKLRSDAIAPNCAFSADHYLAPSLNNESIYYCGASYHLDDDCAELRESDQNTNWAFAEQYCPGVFERLQKLDGRTGFRAVSDDRIPVIGPVPDITWYEAEYGDLKHGRPIQKYDDARYLQGLYISAAHGSRGMTSCFLAAEIIAAQIESTPHPVDQRMIEAISPARFIIRRLKRGV